MDPRQYKTLKNWDNTNEVDKLRDLQEEVANLKRAIYDLMMGIQRIEVNQQQLLFKKENK